MPAAAVIPAPIAYIKVVAVKKLVVGFLVLCFPDLNGSEENGDAIFARILSAINFVGLLIASFTVKKLECLKQAFWL